MSCCSPMILERLRGGGIRASPISTRAKSAGRVTTPTTRRAIGFPIGTSVATKTRAFSVAARPIIGCHYQSVLFARAPHDLWRAHGQTQAAAERRVHHRPAGRTVGEGRGLAPP